MAVTAGFGRVRARGQRDPGGEIHATYCTAEYVYPLPRPDDPLHRRAPGLLVHERDRRREPDVGQRSLRRRSLLRRRGRQGGNIIKGS